MSSKKIFFFVFNDFFSHLDEHFHKHPARTATRGIMKLELKIDIPLKTIYVDRDKRLRVNVHKQTTLPKWIDDLIGTITSTNSHDMTSPSFANCWVIRFSVIGCACFDLQGKVARVSNSDETLFIFMCLLCL